MICSELNAELISSKWRRENNSHSGTWWRRLGTRKPTAFLCRVVVIICVCEREKTPESFWETVLHMVTVTWCLFFVEPLEWRRVLEQSAFFPEMSLFLRKIAVVFGSCELLTTLPYVCIWVFSCTTGRVFLFCDLSNRLGVTLSAYLLHFT